MNSQDLKKKGFTEFPDFKIENCYLKRHPFEYEVLAKSGVYAFCLEKEFRRLKGETDILYIGQAGARSGKMILRRMSDYRLGKATEDDARKHDGLEKIPESHISKLRLLYKITPQNQCSPQEADLLIRFYKSHLELPPMNGSHGSKVVAKQLIANN